MRRQHRASGGGAAEERYMEDGLPRRCRNKFGSPAIRTDHVNRHISQLKVTVVMERTTRSAWWDSHVGTGHSIWKAGPAAATFMRGDASGRIAPRVLPLVPKQTGVGLGDWRLQHPMCDGDAMVSKAYVCVCAD